jgi:hypothetical protein
METFKLPNFICVGAQKAGTTSLYNILKNHSQIFLPDKKEVHFFDSDQNYNRGLEWYSGFFENAKEDQVIGEITPDYMVHSNVPLKIYNSIGSNVKLIFVVRNPAMRAFSQYNMYKKKGVENDNFMDALRKNKGFVNRKGYSDFLYYGYYERGLYHQQITKFLYYFPLKNIKVLIFEELFKYQKQQLFTNILNFLNVKDEPINYYTVSNPTNFKRVPILQNLIYSNSTYFKNLRRALFPFKSLREEIKPYLFSKPDSISHQFAKEINQEMFKGDIVKLENLINKDLSDWYS